jgi:hypothetical protein
VAEGLIAGRAEMSEQNRIGPNSPRALAGTLTAAADAAGLPDPPDPPPLDPQAAISSPGHSDRRARQRSVGNAESVGAHRGPPPGR